MASIRLNKAGEYLLLTLLLFLLIIMYITFGIYPRSFELQRESKSFLGEESDGFDNSDVSQTHAVDVDSLYDARIQLNDGNLLREQNCDVIHIAIVCAGFASNRDLYVLLKSILFHRKDAIQLHLMVNNISQAILAELFDSSRILGLDIKYYNASLYEPDISWVPNRHYSRQFGLLKLVFLSVLADKNENLKKVMLLDTDMLALGDVRTLWDELGRMLNTKRKTHRQAPIFGMVENQSDWYLLRSSENRIVWPAMGKGFNTGLILVDIEELKRNEWQKLWRRTAETYLISHLATSLADQDIFNAVIWQNNHLVQKLPPNYNIQLNDNSKIDGAFLDETNFQLLHWNSPYKLDTKNLLSKRYENWHRTFVDWNGALLQRSSCGSKGSDQYSISSNYADNMTMNQTVHLISCDGIRPSPKTRLRNFLYFLEFDYKLIPYDVTLTVHLSLDRLLALDQLAGNWLGPISVAIYLSEMETSLFMSSIESSFNLAERKNIAYHLVFRDEGYNYPINKLRNIALNNALTDYVLNIDIDFLPSLNLHTYLRTILSEMSKENGLSEANFLQKKALVIPAFETLQYKFQFPNNKAELMSQLNLGSITTFRALIWPKGHSPTDYSRWIVATKPYIVSWKQDYEPFVVTNRNAVRFDERFIGFGWNKVQSIMELAASGYQFIVLPESFLIHKIHAESYDILNHRLSQKYRKCISHLKRTFQHELTMKYPDFFRNISYTEFKPLIP